MVPLQAIIEMLKWIKIIYILHLIVFIDGT